MAHPFLQGPDGEDAPFDAFELALCAEYPDPHGGTFVEQVAGAESLEELRDEAVSFMVSLYGHFPAGGVHSFADAFIDRAQGDYRSYADARDYLTSLAHSLNPALPIEDYSFDPNGDE